MNNIHDIIQRKLDADDIKKCRNFIFDPVTFEPMMSFVVRTENGLTTMVRLSKRHTAQLESLWWFEDAIVNVKTAMMSRVRSFIVP